MTSDVPYESLAETASERWSSTVPSRNSQKTAAIQTSSNLLGNDGPSIRGRIVQTARLRPGRYDHWWWWEVGAAGLSITSMCLVVSILLKTNNRPLSDWKLPIQPNSLIAVFTTVGKAALLVPAATCLSQLKWRHFHLQPRPLDHFQLYDDASRGPWGSLLLLLNLRIRSFLAWALALVTLASLGIDPAAQQILEFAPREVLMTGAKAEISAAVNFLPSAYEDALTITMPRKETALDSLAFDLGFSNSILGKVPDPHYSCPPTATRCTFPPYTTLGVCGTTVDITDRLVHRCLDYQDAQPPHDTCQYDWSENQSAPFSTLGTYINMTIGFGSYPVNASDLGRMTDLFRITLSNDEISDDHGLTYTISFYAIRLANEPPDAEDGAPKAQLQYSSLKFCAQTYANTSVDAGGMHLGPVQSQSLDFIFNQSDPAKLAEADGNGVTYRLYDYSVASMQRYINTVLDRDTPVAATGWWKFGLSQSTSMGLALYMSDLDKVTQDMAAFLSSQIRSPGNRNATAISGQAYGMDTFIVVRWGWLAVPLVETLAVAVLLGITMLITERSRHPRLKTSALGGLFHGLDETAQRQLGDNLSGKETSESLERSARHVVVGMGQDEKGDARLLCRRPGVDG